MKTLIFSVIILAIACKPSTYEGNGETIEKVDAAIFKQVVNQGGLLLDVRTPEEFAEGHLTGAINLDILADDFVDKVNDLDESKTVFVYCRSGGRSENSSKILATAGFKKIYDLDGGITSWEEAGFEVVK